MFSIEIHATDMISINFRNKETSTIKQLIQKFWKEAFLVWIGSVFGSVLYEAIRGREVTLDDLVRISCVGAFVVLFVCGPRVYRHIRAKNLEKYLRTLLHTSSDKP